MAKSRFRIIALRPITPKYIGKEDMKMVRGIQKKVYGSGWLYFYHGYELADAKGYYNLEQGPDDFYGYQLYVDNKANDDSVLYDQEDLCVSIGAVVGPNGSGKSSAIDLMIRLMNNISVAAKGETNNHKAAEHLHFIENVYGSLVALIGDKYIQLMVCGRSVKAAVYEWKEEQNTYVCNPMDELLVGEAITNKYKPIEGSGIGMIQLYNLFYTAIFNYSMYAYNYIDYFDERTKEDRWQNLKNGEEIEERPYNGDYTQERVWLHGLFHKNDGYQTPIVLNPMRENGLINVPKENHLSAERLTQMLFYSNDKRHGHGNQPLFPFRIINEHLEIVSIKLKRKGYEPFSKENIFDSLNFKDNSLTRNFREIRHQLCSIWSQLFCMPYQEETEHEHIAWDYVIYKTIKIAKTYDKYSKLYDDLVYFKNFNPSKVYDELSELLRDESHVTLKLRQALTFLKYKIFREHYDDRIKLYDAYTHYADQLSIYKSMNIRYDEETGTLSANVPEGYSEKDMPQFEIDDNRQLHINIPDNDERPLPLLILDGKGYLNMRIPDHQEMIPPPMFDIELEVVDVGKIDKDGNFEEADLIPLSGLSSGEKQISASISNFVYHLANINSVWEDKNETRLHQFRTTREIEYQQEMPLLKYKYVNVVFDEVELYFHPDLQRRFVKLLLDAIHNVNLEHLEGINIQIVTHSPFVLSDMPVTNVLILGDSPTSLPSQIFAANIYNLLNNTFFLPNAIGDFAREEIERLATTYRNQVLVWYANDSSNENRQVCQESLNDFTLNKDKYKYLCSIVGDDYLRDELKDMFNELDGFYTAQKI